MGSSSRAGAEGARLPTTTSPLAGSWEVRGAIAQQHYGLRGMRDSGRLLLSLNPFCSPLRRIIGSTNSLPQSFDTQGASPLRHWGQIVVLRLAV